MDDPDHIISPEPHCGRRGSLSDADLKKLYGRVAADSDHLTAAASSPSFSTVVSRASTDGSMSTIECALQLARSGECHSMEDLRRALKSEGYDAIDGNLAGSSIQAQLKAAMDKARC